MGRLARLVRASLLLAVLGSVAQVGLLAVLDPPLTLTMVGASWDRARAGDGIVGPVHHSVSLAEMGAHLPRAAVSAEDARFLDHHGFDTDAIVAAWEANQAGRPLRGGSTISQQVARNVFLWQGRNWLRKGLEAGYTVWMELLLPKRRILEVYLNVAQCGPRQFGVHACAAHWFGRAPAELTADQARRLVAMFPAPSSWTPDHPEVQRRAEWIRRNSAPWPAGGLR